MKPRHSIVIITYNQEKLIGRAIESLLCQKEYIYEIIVADDCSTDNTWEVIQNYTKQYPDIIKPYSNHVNLGIFGNWEGTWSKVNGDIFWLLAGDDVYCNGLFEEANMLIEKHNINIKNDTYTLYFDYKAIDPNGNEYIYRNNLIKHHAPISLKIRQLICNRTIGISRKVFEKFYPINKDIGIMADGLLDIQVQIFSERSFYSPFIGSIYYSNIGISSVTKKEASIKSYILSLEELKNSIKPLLKKDENWLNYLQSQLSYKLNPSYKNLFSYWKLFFRIVVNYYGWLFVKREFITIFKDTPKIFLHNLNTLSNSSKTKLILTK